VAVELSCPACGEAEELRGERREGAIWITCGDCGHEWPRDRDRCPRCGERSIADRREPLLQKARGTQQSIVGYRIVQECWRCGYRSAA
jgi:formate dehydrogenase maturation protein FdhE